MRLRQLSLDLFGHFSGKSYDFGEKQTDFADFHVIYGPNEAGKTTTMEAFLRLIFGFPHRDAYDFLHQRKNLTVSGTLEIGGHERFLKRVSSRNNSLIDENGKALPEALLQAHLGGLSEEDYRHLLCLDDETIERGGEEIASSKGDIGRLLFSAAAGVSDLTNVLDHIRGQADELYRKRASTTEMARLKKELADIERKIKEQDVPASQYRKLKQSYEQALAEEAAFENERKEKRLDLAKTKARLAALPLLLDIDRLAAAIAPFAEYPQQLDFNAEDLVELLTRQTRLTSDTERLEKELDQLSIDLNEIQREPQHLNLGAELENLDELRSRYLTAERDLPRRRKSLDDVLLDMHAQMRALGADEEEPEKLALSQGQLSEMAQAREEKRDAYHMQLAEQEEIETLNIRLEAAQKDILNLKNAENTPSGVKDILTRFSAQRFLPQHAKAQQAITDAKRRFRNALDGLAIKDLVFDQVPACHVSGEEAAGLAENHRDLSEKLAHIIQSLSDHQKDADIVQSEIDAIKLSQGLSDDTETELRMKNRNQLWLEHKELLSQVSANKFEQAMFAVDESADKRLAQAEIVGQMRVLTQRLHRLTIEIDALGKQKSELEAALGNLDAEFKKLIETIGFPASTPPMSFANWAKKRDEAALIERQMQHVLDEHQDIIAKAERLYDALLPLIDLDAPDFDSLIDAALDLQTREQEQADKALALEKNHAELQADYERRESRLVQFEKQAEAANLQWQSLIEQNLGYAVSPDDVERGFEQLREIAHLNNQRSGFARQVEGMEADQAEFAEKIAETAHFKGLDSDLPPLETFMALEKISQTAQAIEARWQQLDSRKIAVLEEREAVKISSKEIDNQVTQLAQIFPVHVATDTLPQLRIAVADAANAIEQSKQMELSATKICADLSLPDIESVRQELSGLSAHELSVEVDNLEDALSDIEEKHKKAIELRSDAAGLLARVTGEGDIAALTEMKVTLEAQIEDAALRYLEFDLGHRLAEEAIRRYRDKHRSGMMDATEKIFFELTNGAYSKLYTQPEGNNEILKALDAGGTAKQAGDMSKGTRFQLYLALRAAAYEQLVSQGVCLPFFCDDIFETFDEERTRAACRVMARIGHSGQAIYLTHHRHVVDIALKECGSNVKIHEIDEIHA